MGMENLSCHAKDDRLAVKFLRAWRNPGIAAKLASKVLG